MKKYLTKKDIKYLFELIKKLVAQFHSQKPSTRRIGYSPDFSTFATGFGYEDTIKLCFFRGKQLREVKSHVKAEVLIGVRGSNKSTAFCSG